MVSSVVGVATDVTKINRTEREREAVISVSQALRTVAQWAEIFPIIVGQLHELLGVNTTAIITRDDVSDEMVVEVANNEWAEAAGFRFEQGQGVSGLVMQSGAPYINNNTQTASQGIYASAENIRKVKCVACVPLTTDEEIVGVIWIGKNRWIDEQDIHVLQSIAGIAAIAMRRIKLTEQTTTQIDRLTALRTIEAVISASHDLSGTLETLVDQVVARLKVDAAAVSLKISEDRLRYAAGHGFWTDLITQAPVPIAESYSGQAAYEKRTIQLHDLKLGDADKKDNQDFIRMWKQEGFKAYYSLPLIAKGEFYGVLEIYHRSPISPDPEWEDFLEMVAGQAAIAIHDTTLFNSLESAKHELELAYDDTLEGWARALELRDYETVGHTRRVAENTVELARRMGFGDEELVQVRRGALLHDIGKMGIPDQILNKPGKLTEEEWEIMRKHPVYAYEMLEEIDFLGAALDIPHYHHEKWDGSGYPSGLKGEEIPLPARVFAIVDVWDALLSDRPYRKGWPEGKVLEYLKEQSGSHFDPLVVEEFLGMMEEKRLDDKAIQVSVAELEIS
jgi:putative nucleotidyltransferase with HDIG domain